MLSFPPGVLKGALQNDYKRITAVSLAMSDTSRSVLEFGRFRLEPAESRLTKGGAPVQITPKALELLVALATRPGRLVTKEELVALVWPDTFVEEGNLAVHITRLRQVLNDDTGQSY